MRTITLVALSLVAAPVVLAGGPYGLAKAPPLGWRSWNAYHADVSQELMETVIDKLTETNPARTVNGKVMSLAQVGYSVVGLDDNWQACGTGVNGSFHDAEGNPLVNTTTFPSMKNLTAYAHSKGLKTGFYMNNCICHENSFTDPDYIRKVYERSVAWLVDNEWDGVKLDGCSQFHNTTLWAQLMNDTGRDFLVENCHNTVEPSSTSEWGGQCPFNWYRSSTDIQAHWGSIWSNLQTVKTYETTPPLSRPSCWAYPDMLEVGNLATYNESRSHFGAWCINSSPLILGYDITNEGITNTIWDIITNTEAIQVNQQWAGEAGKFVIATAPPIPTPPTPGKFLVAVPCNSSDATQLGFSYSPDSKEIVDSQGNCVDGTNQQQINLLPCNGSPAQAFTHTAAGPFINPATGKCIDVWEGAGAPGGPQVQLYDYHDGSNEHFKVSNGMIADETGVCFASRSTIPAPTSGGVQVWRKLQPNGAVAVLFISNNAFTSPPVSVSLADLGLTSSSASVRDIWAHADLPDVSDVLTSKPLATHDSEFYLLTPK